MNDQLLAEIESGQGEPLSRAAKRLPSYRNGRPVTLSCLVRWVLTGVKTPAGQTIRLEAARLAGRWITTPAALSRFIARQTPDLNTPMPPSAPTAAQRKRRAEAAGAALARAGI